MIMTFLCTCSYLLPLFHNVNQSNIFHIHIDANESKYEYGKCYNDLHCEKEEVIFFFIRFE